MKVSKGLATWAGLVAAAGQYLAAVAVFLEADNQSDALGPLVTATATLLAVIVGRMQQAKALAAGQTPMQRLGQQARQLGFTVTGDAGQINQAAGKARALGEPTDLSLEIPGGGFPQDGERP